MRHTKYLFFLFICLFLNACKDNNDPGGNGGGGGDRPETLAWIEDTMREYYYWYDEIPAASGLNYKSGEEDFFGSLLTKKDGRTINGNHYPYSYIEDISTYTRSSINENLSYGIEFTGLYIEENKIGALILYVVPGSPADDAGLERGDWIIKIDNKDITTNEVYATLEGTSKPRTLTIARWDPTIDNGPEYYPGALVIHKENVDLAAARAVVDNPVHTYKRIDRGGKSIGYLLYNHFSDGIDDNDKSYDNELRNLSSSFFNGVDEFVLDLRYNNGGLLSSAILLSTILCPESYLVNTRLGYLKYNDKQQIPNRYFNVNQDNCLKHGKNLNLNKLYVLTSSSSASASELIINSLRVYMDVIVIGDQTVGKNVGSIHFPNDDEPYPYDGDNPWVLHPIVSQISNADNFTDYSDGFKPGTYKKGQGMPTVEGVYIDEAFDFVTINGQLRAKINDLLPFGNENERMLKVALDMIDGTYRSAQPRSGTSNEKAYKRVPFNSLDRKATNGVIIDIP